MTLVVQAAFPQVGAGVGADLFVNTWHIETRGATTPHDAGDEFIDALEEFYGAIAGNWSDSVIASPGHAKVYDLTDPIPRSAVVEGNMIVDPVATGALPTEVALCLSYRAAFASGESKARARGRVFLGGFNRSAAVLADTGLAASDLLNAVATAAQTLLDASDASTKWRWVVWSTVDATSRPVIGGWVDNAFDTQRRRGLEATGYVGYGAGH